jgi:hypothetical protein
MSEEKNYLEDDAPKENSIDYPPVFPCTICGHDTLREKGDSYYKYSYRCVNKKCHRSGNPLYGTIFTSEIADRVDGGLQLFGVANKREKDKRYVVTYKNGNFSIQWIDDETGELYFKKL